LLPDLFSSPFDYGHVDGFGRAYQRGTAPTLNGQSFRADRLGPVIEFENLASVEDSSALPATDWFDDNPLGAFFEARSGPASQWLDSSGCRGIIKGGSLGCDRTLTSFKVDAHKAALAANFGKAAPLLIAAMGELIGNVVDHSEAVETALIVFSAQNRLFEFVVADRGIGALDSLRKSSEHVLLSDHGAALNAMIETGVSRFGSGTGHGNGFQPIFERLADMQGFLRFRSGDYALTLDGQFGDKLKLQLSQKPRLTGFLAAVVCRA
jgi:hypothetical protein